MAKYRDIFPPTSSATPKLHTLLRYTELYVLVYLLTWLRYMNVLIFCRILVQICKTQAFQKLNPAQFELHDEVSDAIQVSNHMYHLILCSYKKS